eukprot:Plantae.Rhodophyta-Hildenbrandia_rubra.ctg443.p1 GENE.Plantae.Rhodophyta-Hildenbrandia_rubra.ctg443~~Plantae.Rhodophyta-Hildenbrandia_rubra.ctg443.p1  ORF type:complete len:653 (+),score=75.47 Plantae.Rhodophyta-Hildenbrandia_rubra.ctg443:1926-3884(+)
MLATFSMWRRHNKDSTPVPPIGRQRGLERRTSSLARRKTPRPIIDSEGLEDEMRTPSEPWLLGFLIVGFDLIKGQVCECAMPEDFLTREEKETVSFYAMPDTSAGGAGTQDALYSFRLVREPNTADEDVRGKAALRNGPRLLLAHSLFRQAKDPNSPRGCFQKSLVIISGAPCLTLPRTLLKILAADAFCRGASALKEAMTWFEQWPDPRVQEVKRTLELPFMNETISVSLPDCFLSSFSAPAGKTIRTFGRQASESAYKSEPGAVTPDLSREWPLCMPSGSPSAAPFHEIDISRSLESVIDKVHHLWELLLLGEPLIIFATTPSQVSAAVLSVLGLSHPIPFTGDWRPCFCVQDPDYSTLAKATNGQELRHCLPKGAVFGATNILLKTTLAFPNTLTIRDDQCTAEVAGVSNNSEKSGLVSSVKSQLQHASGPLTSAIRAAKKIITFNRGKKLSDQISSHQVAFEIRRCVLECITKPFLRAFDYYFTPCILNNSSNEMLEATTCTSYISDPFGKTLRLPDFDADCFPTKGDLARRGVLGIFRGGSGNKQRARAFYKKFCDGPMFDPWFECATKLAEKHCASLHRHTLLHACVRGPQHAQDLEYSKNLLQRVQKEWESATVAQDVSLMRKLNSFKDLVRDSLPQKVREDMDI